MNAEMIFEQDDRGIGLLRFNRPQVRNALSWSAMECFRDLIEQAYDDRDLRVLILTGDKRAFCAGGDLAELHSHLSRVDGVRLMTLMGEALNRLAEFPAPTIAAIEGAAMGGGAEISLACDMRVLAEDAHIGLMHVRLAISPAWGGALRLLRTVGYARAFEWLVAGRVLTGEQAYRYGLANRLTPPGQAMAEARALAETIAAYDPAAVHAIKRMLRAGRTLDPSSAAAAERREFPVLWAAPAHTQASADFIARKQSRSARA
ncbi:MAG: enoyl-CoA hydratase/isomerase family protein [Anaerolineales bacterium]|jgi:enoyl-CoA hydratase/carnithine racemase